MNSRIFFSLALLVISIAAANELDLLDQDMSSLRVGDKFEILQSLTIDRFARSHCFRNGHKVNAGTVLNEGEACCLDTLTHTPTVVLQPGSAPLIVDIAGGANTMATSQTRKTFERDKWGFGDYQVTSYTENFIPFRYVSLGRPDFDAMRCYGPKVYSVKQFVGSEHTVDTSHLNNSFTLRTMLAHLAGVLKFVPRPDADRSEGRRHILDSPYYDEGPTPASGKASHSDSDADIDPSKRGGAR